MGTRTVALIVACALAGTGCDLAFGISTVDAALGPQDPDAAHRDPDSVPDSARICPDGSHDEDGDGVPDACDNCPTVANADQANLGEITAGHAADTVGDACDPHPDLPGDAVLLFYPFTGGAVDARTIGTSSFHADDVAIYGDFSALITNLNYTPTRIVVDLTFGGQPPQEVQLSANSGGFRCDVTTAPCPTGVAGGCLTSEIQPVMSVPFSGAPQVMQIDMFATDATHIGCAANAGGFPTTVVNAATFTTGQIAIYTLQGSTQVTATSLIAYGMAPP